MTTLSIDPALVNEPRITVTDPPLRLNLGCGSIEIPGYVNIDRKLGSVAYPLPYPDESVDEVRASHVLEHFDMKESPKVFAEWVRVLKPGGVLKVAVPNLERWAQELLNGNPGDLLSVLYGGQRDNDDYHKSGFNPAGLERMFRMNGLVCVEAWQSEIKDCASLTISLNLQGIKPAPIKRTMCCLMSTPRLLHKHNYLALLEVMVRRNIPLFDFGGAYWHQGMERLMRQHWDDHEWILTVDYDSLFNVGHFDRLCTIFERHPEADALAPLQMRREEAALLSGIDFYDKPDMLDGSDLMPARHAHFGFTLFRCDRLKKFGEWCRERKEPMMLETSGRNYDFGDDKMDADMNFWKRFSDAGFNLYSTPNVGVGHIEEVGTWVSQHFGTIYQPVSMFHREGIPAEARK